MNNKYPIVLLLLIIFNLKSYAQNLSDDLKIAKDLEDVTIISKPIDEQFFIELILKDVSLYESFTNMRFYSFIAENNILTYSNDTTSARIYKKVAHCNYNNNYKQITLDSLDSGKVYKRNGKYRLFTVQMFSYLFENINSTDFTSYKPNYKKNIFNKELYKEKLKTLVFNPGKKVTELPFISNKSEIFSPKLKKYYQSKISTITYKGMPAYLFEYYVNPKYANYNSLIIQKLNTVIHKYNLKILSRFIHLKYENLLLKFDINMGIETTIISNMLLPSEIKYDGIWHILFKKTEKVKFNVYHYDYIKNHIAEYPTFCQTIINK